MTVELAPKLEADGLVARLSGGVEALVVRSTPVTEEAIAGADRLRIIVRAGAGVDTIDIEAASRRGIFVCNCPGKNAVAVAELTVALALALDRRLPQASAALAAGRWDKRRFGGADGLQGKTWGVVGVGRVGRALIPRIRALGVEIIGHSRSLDEARAARLEIGRSGSIESLAARSDILSIHLARCPATAGCIDLHVLAALPRGAMVVNTSRGGIVDEEAMLEALDDGRVRYATDVFADEPDARDAPFEHPIAAHPDAICTPHIAASTRQAQRAVADEVVRILEAYASTGATPNVLNLGERPAGAWKLDVRHLNRVGVLAEVLLHIRRAGLNVAELENVIFATEAAACAHIQLAARPDDELVADIEALDEVFDVRRTRLNGAQPPG
jgi:D-3-phosphoglycerate dehydrogenase